MADVEESLLGYPTIRSSGCEILICIGPAKMVLAVYHASQKPTCNGFAEQSKIQF